MTTYKLINPHDDYSFEAPDDDVANVVVILLHPMYGWASADRSAMPGLADPCSDAGEDMLAVARAVLEHRSAEVSQALRSLEIKPDQRKRLGVDSDKWHDEMRSSDSDPRAAAIDIADRLDAKVTA